mmetsp:Transcript_26089/g.29855  ORF Transcript_26089/g.29855 Transcript_26089/m.29855 type:complete len:215 (+) Transcript_26089:124-768(+)
MSSLWTVSPNKFLGPPSISISVPACGGSCSLLLLFMLMVSFFSLLLPSPRLSRFVIRLSFVTVPSMVLLFPFEFAFEDWDPGMSKIPSSPTSHCPAIKRKLPLFRIPSKARCCCTEDFEPLLLAVPYVPPDVVRSNLVTFKPAKVAPKDKCVTSFLLVDVLVEEASEVRSRRPKILGPLFSSSSSSSSFILIFFCVRSSGTTSSNNKNHSCGSY